MDKGKINRMNSEAGKVKFACFFVCLNKLSLKNGCILRDNYKISMFYLLIKPGSRQRAPVFFCLMMESKLDILLKTNYIVCKVNFPS